MRQMTVGGGSERFGGWSDRMLGYVRVAWGPQSCGFATPELSCLVFKCRVCLLQRQIEAGTGMLPLMPDYFLHVRFLVRD